MLVDHASAPRVFRNVAGVQITDQGNGALHLEQVRSSVHA
jgi:hypothetical protein